jgi:hypothetical protein
VHFFPYASRSDEIHADAIDPRELKKHRCILWLIQPLQIPNCNPGLIRITFFELQGRPARRPHISPRSSQLGKTVGLLVQEKPT